jgi:hypothetical protein
MLQHAYLVAGKLLKHEKRVGAPGQDDTALQAMYNKDMRTYTIQYVARVMHKVGNGYMDLHPMCVRINIGLKCPDREGIYMGCDVLRKC